ncbi:MAG: transglycosylase domain-containing protein, partial [Clostridia bacterium]|nr:transglycosylase domain-containing protein [Clostridia bacterium]
MKKKISKILLKITAFALCTVLIFCASASLFFFSVTKDTHLDESKFARTQNIAVNIYDTTNTPLDKSEFFSEKRYVTLNELPAFVPQAFIATEDRRFYSHHGIDLKRMASASLKNLKNKKFSQGASTITQQLIKNTHLSQEKTLTRKLKEIKLSFALEQKLSKDEILEEYLNSIYFGNGAYGIESASKKYFNKEAKDLTLGESAMLAGIIKAPTYYDPINKNEASEKRKKIVLTLMKNQGYITEEEYQKNANSHENIVKNTSKTPNLYKKQIISEICNNLKITENQLKNLKIDVKTSIDKSLDKKINNLINQDKYSLFGTDNYEVSSAV